jgi:hypothetical protein
MQPGHHLALQVITVQIQLSTTSDGQEYAQEECETSPVHFSDHRVEHCRQHH